MAKNAHKVLLINKPSHDKQKPRKNSSKMEEETVGGCEKNCYSPKKIEKRKSEKRYNNFIWTKEMLHFIARTKEKIQLSKEKRLQILQSICCSNYIAIAGCSPGLIADYNRISVALWLQLGVVKGEGKRSACRRIVIIPLPFVSNTQTDFLLLYNPLRYCSKTRTESPGYIRNLYINI